MGDAGDDGPLVAAARDGSEAAWRGLYLLHHRRLVVWFSTIAIGDAALSAEDVAAEAWTVAAGKIAEFTGSDHDFGGWLIAIGRNIATNHARRSARRRTNPADELPDRPALGGDLAASVVGDDWAREALALLTRREAEVVACIDVVGLDVAATAKALGMTTTGVRVARHRALGRLRRLLPPPESGDDWS